MEDPRTASLQTLFRESVRLYHRLRAAAETVHGRGPLAGALRSVALDLWESGPRTVPDLARERPVARQYMQKIVDELRARGWAELRENPRHRRSRLVALRPAGERAAKEILARERALLRDLPLGVAQEDIDAAIQVLRAAREAMARLQLDLARQGEVEP